MFFVYQEIVIIGWLVCVPVVGLLVGVLEVGWSVAGVLVVGILVVGFNVIGNIGMYMMVIYYDVLKLFILFSLLFDQEISSYVDMIFKYTYLIQN